MKYVGIWCIVSKGIVAPLAGAWIEIYGDMLDAVEKEEVAPLAGAWIEIIMS